MKPDEWRYFLVALTLSAGVATGLGAALGAWAFASYMIAFYLVYMNSVWLHETIDRIANGKGEK